MAFQKKENTFLVNSHFDDAIEIYAKNNCKNSPTPQAIQQDAFPIDENTQSINISLKNNPKYNVFKKSDRDNDWVEDEIDNCKNRYNPDQKDSI